MNSRPRLLWDSFLCVNGRMVSRRMSDKTKALTHYEILEVNHRATQGEIKSAYFKLSKKYHPDKNSTAAATAKFHDIAEAYEVLGNFDTRKMYDRSILTHSKYQVPRHQETGTRDDPRVKEYHKQAAAFRDNLKTSQTPTYDFDAWAKAHYEWTLNRSLKDRAESAYRREMRIDLRNIKAGQRDMIPLSAILLYGITLLLLLTYETHDYDDPSIVPKLNESELEIKSAKDNVSKESLVAK